MSYTAPIQPPGKTIRFLMKQRHFAEFWVATLHYNLTYWLHILVIQLLMYDITQSNTWVGAASFALMLPTALITPAAGVMADRFRRKTIVNVTVAVLGTVVGLFGMLYGIGELTPMLIILLCIALGVNDGVQLPPWQSMVPQMVSSDILPDALRFYQVQYTSALALGPLLGAMLLKFLGFGHLFIINTTIIFMVLVVMMRIKIIEPPPLPEAEQKTPLQGFKEGVSYVKAHRNLMFVIGGIFLVSFFGWPMVQVAAGLAQEVYSTGELGVAGFITASGAGAAVGVMLMFWRGERTSRSRMALAGMMLYSVGLLLTAATSIYWLGLTGFVLVGASHMLVGMSLYTALQVQVAERIRGRVVSLHLIGVFCGISLGSLTAGALGDVFGPQMVYLGAGLVMASMTFILMLNPGLLHLLNQKLLKSQPS